MIIFFAHEVLDPPLTSVNYPKTITGKTGINMLLDQINNKENESKTIIIEPGLVKRDSVKKIN